MVQETKRFLSYICPRCMQTVIVERDLFALAAAPARIKCPCGRSELGVEFQPERVRIKAPCLFCGQEHTVSCSSRAFIREKALAFSCAASGLDCCYVGEEGPVYAAAARLEQAVDKLGADAAEQGTFLDGLVMEEILSEVRDIAARGGISCTCGSRRWGFDVHFSAVELFCRDCGGRCRIPAATAGDIDDLCCKTSILIRGEEK